MHNFIFQYSDIAKLNMQVATETTTTAAVATATISTIVTIAATTEHQIQHHH